MENRFSRSELILGKNCIEALKNARVAIFGIGGVGSYCAEALARSGIGTLDLIDNDTVNITNINRQLYALESTIGKYKTDVAKMRCLDINPDMTVNTYQTFYMPDTSNSFDLTKYDYIIDAIDTVAGKIELIVRATEAHTPIISSMGAGNKLHAEMFEICDIYKTSMCPLARVMRYELKRRGIKNLTVVYSKEKPLTPANPNTSDDIKPSKNIAGSVSFVPPVAGLIAAGKVVRDLCKISD